MLKTYTLKSAAKNQETNTVWDAFVEYLETVYSEGAVENLDQELVNFEYEARVVTGINRNSLKELQEAKSLFC